jgi:hypothetical protein
MGPIFVFLLPIFYVGLLIVLVSGWIRGGREGRTRDPFVLFSRFGFILGTWSAAMAVQRAVLAKFEGKFQYHSPKLGWLYVIGGLFALAGVVLSVLGVRSKSSVTVAWPVPVSRYAAALVHVAVWGINRQINGLVSALPAAAW